MNYNCQAQINYFNNLQNSTTFNIIIYHQISSYIIIMSKPNSIKTEPWTSYGKFAPSNFTDDFCHKDSLTLKFKSTSADNATINIKQSSKSFTQIDIKDQIKLWFPFKAVQGSSLYSRINNKNFKLHYDHGQTTLRGHNWNFYGSVGFEKNLKKLEVKVGGESLSQHCDSNNRIKYNHDEHGLIWYHKTLLTYNNFRFGTISVYDISKNILSKKDLIFGYINNPYSVYLRAEQDWDKNAKGLSKIANFPKLTLTALWNTTDQNRNGVQISVNPVNQTLQSFNLLTQYSYNKDNLLKLKINDKLNTAFVLKKKVNNNYTFSVGGQYLKVAQTNQQSGLKVGMQLEVNI